MLEQSKYRTDKLFKIGAYILTGLILFQPACYSGKTNQTTVSASSTERLETGNKQPETISTPSRQNYLTQEQLTDVAKLAERYQTATEKDKEIARFLIEESYKDIQKNWFRVAAEGFLESTLVFPTVESLVMAAKCNARIDEANRPEAERLEAVTANFDYSVKLFETAKGFAGKTGQGEELKKYPDLDEHLDCLKSFLTKKDEKQTCEYVKDILRANKIK